MMEKRDGLAESLLDAIKRTSTETAVRLLIRENGAATKFASRLLADLAELQKLDQLYSLKPHTTTAQNGTDHGGAALPVVPRGISSTEVLQLMQDGAIDAVLFESGAIAENGDAQVKNGDLAVAIFANHFKIPCFAVAVVSALCLEPSRGTAHPDHEILSASLLKGILTENGFIYPQGSQFDLPSFVKYGIRGAGQFSSFTPLTEALAMEYIKSHPTLAEVIGPVDATWTCREAGDGNINFVYIVEGPNGGLVVKQGLPYIRLVGESWKLTQDRVRIEAKWLMQQHRVCPDHIPFVHSFDETMSLIAMQYLPPPFINLRAGILEGQIYPLMASHVAKFLAETLFSTSALALDAETYRNRVTEFLNAELCKATEQVIFMDAYYEAPTSFYLKPELDEVVAELGRDVLAKKAIAKLRNLFLSKPQALIHADFHTGSAMATQEGTYVIDGEFAFYGPMAFDVGKFIGNLLLTYFALDGHDTETTPRADQQKWLLDSAIELWEGFEKRFLELWDEHRGEGGGYPTELISSPSDTLSVLQSDFMETLFGEIADYTTIQDRSVRAACSKRALQLAKKLLLNGSRRDSFPDIQNVIKQAQDIRSHSHA